MQLIDVIEIKSGKTKQVGEWALKDPKQLANLGLRLADETQSQGLSDAESISNAVKKKLKDAAEAKANETKPLVQDEPIEPVHELVNPLEDYENIDADEKETPVLVEIVEPIDDATTEVEPLEEVKVEKKKAGRPAKAK